MRLTYRGHQYNLSQPAIALQDTGLTAIFRGSAYPLLRAASLPFPTNVELTYRGIPYSRTPKVTTAKVSPKLIETVLV